MQGWYHKLMAERIKRFEELRGLTSRSKEQEEEYQWLNWMVQNYLFPLKNPPFLIETVGE